MVMEKENHNRSSVFEKIMIRSEIASIGFGTGENGLNPDYFNILDYLHNRRIKLTPASSGYTLSITPDEMLPGMRCFMEPVAHRAGRKPPASPLEGGKGNYFDH